MGGGSPFSTQKAVLEMFHGNESILGHMGGYKTHSAIKELSGLDEERRESVDTLMSLLSVQKRDSTTTQKVQSV